jgi:hypothetical protein
MKFKIVCAVAVLGLQMSNFAWATCWVGNIPGNGMFCCDKDGCRVIHQK